MKIYKPQRQSIPSLVKEKAHHNMSLLQLMAWKCSDAIIRDQSRIGLSNAIKKAPKTITESGALNDKKQTKPNDIVIETPYANKIKIEKYDNVDKIKASICVISTFTSVLISYVGRYKAGIFNLMS
jgi:hypothetical protein